MPGMQKPFRLEEATIDELHAAIKAGAITCVQIVQHYIARARAYNGVASALVTEDDAPIPPASGTVRAGAPLRFPSGSIDGTYARDKRPIDGTRSPHPALSHAPRFLDRGKDVPRPGPRERRRSPLLPCLILLWTPAWRADRAAVGRHRLAAEDHLCPALDRPFRQGPDQDGGVDAGVGRVSRVGSPGNWGTRTSGCLSALLPFIRTCAVGTESMRRRPWQSRDTEDGRGHSMVTRHRKGVTSLPVTP